MLPHYSSVITLIIAIGVPVLGQTISFGPQTRSIGTVTGKPFSGRLEEQRRDTASTIWVTGHLYRDAAGRERRESEIVIDKSIHFVVIGISDPVAGHTYAVDPQAKRVVAQPFVQTSARTPPQWLFPASPGTMPAPAHEKIEGLGCQVITLGESSTFAAIRGSIWISDELQVVLKEDLHAEGFESRFRMFDIQRSEPAVELFRPPKDYVIIDDALGPK
jgi:hypothetical protein